MLEELAPRVEELALRVEELAPRVGGASSKDGGASSKGGGASSKGWSSSILFKANSKDILMGLTQKSTFGTFYRKFWISFGASFFKLESVSLTSITTLCSQVMYIYSVENQVGDIMHFNRQKFKSVDTYIFLIDIVSSFTKKKIG